MGIRKVLKALQVGFQSLQEKEKEKEKEKDQKGVVGGNGVAVQCALLPGNGDLEVGVGFFAGCPRTIWGVLRYQPGCYDASWGKPERREWAIWRFGDRGWPTPSITADLNVVREHL